MISFYGFIHKDQLRVIMKVIHEGVNQDEIYSIKTQLIDDKNENTNFSSI